MKTLKENKPREIGRPRAFDKDAALDKALMLFWEKGYEGTSLADLTEALAINRPSLYAAFGNKEALFHQALRRYHEGPTAYIGQAMQEPTSRGAIEMFLRRSADLLTNPDNPNGCLVVQGALSCSQASQTIRQALIEVRKSCESIISRRLEQGQVAGDFSIQVQAPDFARYIATVHQGMSVQAASGASRQELQTIIDRVLSHWPD